MLHQMNQSLLRLRQARSHFSSRDQLLARGILVSRLEHVDRGSWSDWTTTAYRKPDCPGRGWDVEHGAGRPHHARSVSVSRSTCMASTRLASSAANPSPSARIAAAAFRRAASMSAARTAVDIGVPSLVKAASARDASSSGRKVIVSAKERTYCTAGGPEASVGDAALPIVVTFDDQGGFAAPLGIGVVDYSRPLRAMRRR